MGRWEQKLRSKSQCPVQAQAQRMRSDDGTARSSESQMELDFVVGSASLIRLLRGGIRVLCNEMLVWSVPREAPLHLLPESEREDDLTPQASHAASTSSTKASLVL